MAKVHYPLPSGLAPILVQAFEAITEAEGFRGDALQGGVADPDIGSARGNSQGLVWRKPLNAPALHGFFLNQHGGRRIKMLEFGGIKTDDIPNPGKKEARVRSPDRP